MKNTLEMPAEMSEIVVINDSNNFAPSLCRHRVKSLVTVLMPRSKTVTSDFTQ